MTMNVEVINRGRVELDKGPEMNKHRSPRHWLSWKTEGENFSGAPVKKNSHMLQSDQVK